MCRMLQWGRGRMAAEGAALERLADMVDALQWGRGRMAAEGFSPRAFTRRTISFNGAAAGWPRKGDLRGRRRLDRRELQWGRGRMAAESMAPMSDVSTSRSFNGAAAGWPRKVRTKTDVRTLLQLQWGRGRMAAEGAGHAHY